MDILANSEFITEELYKKNIYPITIHILNHNYYAYYLDCRGIARFNHGKLTIANIDYELINTFIELYKIARFSYEMVTVIYDSILYPHSIIHYSGYNTNPANTRYIDLAGITYAIYDVFGLSIVYDIINP